MRTDTAIRYKPRMPSRDYQLEACARMRGRHAFALTMYMRTGKSKTLLDDFGAMELAGEVEDLLIIAPAGVYLTWMTAIQDHVSDDLAKRLRVHTWTSGPGKKQRADLQDFLHDMTRPRAFLVNVEALSTTTGAREAVEEFLAPRRSMAAVDESTIIKNHKAERTKFVCRVVAPRADYRRILSGLPTPRSPLDLYCQYEFLDLSILRQASYFGFMHRYAIVKKTDFGGRLKRPAHIVVGYRNEDELRRLTEPHSFRVEFRPDIPSTYSFREVALSKEQARIYAEMKRHATAEIEAASHVTASLVIVKMLRLHQILCGHVVDEQGVEHEIPECRTQAVLDILDDYSGKAVIWCSYDADIRKVSAAIAEEYTTEDPETGEKKPGKVARFWGGNVRTREEEERMFQADPECRWMVATPDAGGRGRTWDAADLVIFYSSKNNLEHRDQAESRTQNVGKARGVDYIDLICPGTVDGAIIKALRDKIDMASAITGSDWRQWLI
jgi:hypothetical protein